MSKKLHRILLVLVLIVICLLLTDIAINLHFKKSFAPNTWINTIYCTGRSVDEINKELIEISELSDIVIIDIDNRSYTVSAEDIGLQPDYTSEVRRVMKARSNYNWLTTLRESYSTTVSPEYYKWDRAAFTSCFEQMDFYVKEKEAEDKVQVNYDDNQGYYLQDGKPDRLNLERAKELVDDAIFNGQFVINLYDLGCYETHPDSQADTEQRMLWSKLEDYFSCDITFDMGAEQVPVSNLLLSNFLKKNLKNQPVLDDSGNLIVDEDKVNEWLVSFLTAYNTEDTERDFQSTSGRVIKVKYNNYGTLIDVDAEKEYLYDAILSKKKEVHTPVYLKEGFFRGKDDIGPTYVEVDMGEQKLYYYLDGELKIEADVVTGNMKRKFNTPEGINYVEYMQRNRVLVGENYRTPVKYWIRVVGNIGIHDASWRNEFGGDIYLTNGSHGCVNTPLEKVSELYEMIELGTPVVMFY